eukprot:TRINITY_DN3337_c1_g3_i1.p1 TRINITY_DN3337_c1_g3~~TRINITY_DN3337_c1_g3_i1.p1  ORF type:complete len:296 (+),score=70.61 TRINITY_DN3337_c1_g3_i1:97-984(+)
MLSDPVVVDMSNPWGKKTSMMMDPDWEDEVEGEITLLDQAADLCQLPAEDEDQFKHPAATLLPPEIGFREIKAATLAVQSLTPIYVPRKWGTPIAPSEKQDEKTKKESPPTSPLEKEPESDAETTIPSDDDEGKPDEDDAGDEEDQPEPIVGVPTTVQQPSFQPMYLPFPYGTPVGGQMPQMNVGVGVGMTMLPTFPNMNPQMNAVPTIGNIPVSNGMLSNNLPTGGMPVAPHFQFPQQQQQQQLPTKPGPQVGKSPKNGLYIPLADCRQMITVGGNLLPSLPNPGFPQPAPKPR